MEYIFTLKYALLASDYDLECIVDSLGEAGCNDALIGIGKPGRLALEFTREAVDAKTAVSSAMADVHRGIPSAKLIEVAPDLVGLTDVASILDMSRQNMRKIMLNHQNNFPLPVHDGKTALWHLAEILSWLQDNRNYQVDHKLLDVARVALHVNLDKENQRFVNVSRGVEKSLLSA